MYCDSLPSTSERVDDVTTVNGSPTEAGASYLIMTSLHGAKVSHGEFERGDDVIRPCAIRMDDEKKR